MQCCQTGIFDHGRLGEVIADGFAGRRAIRLGLRPPFGARGGPGVGADARVAVGQTRRTWTRISFFARWRVLR